MFYYQQNLIEDHFYHPTHETVKEEITQAHQVNSHSDSNSNLLLLPPHIPPIKRKIGESRLPRIFAQKLFLWFLGSLSDIWLGVVFLCTIVEYFTAMYQLDNTKDFQFRVFVLISILLIMLLPPLLLLFLFVFRFIPSQIGYWFKLLTEQKQKTVSDGRNSTRHSFDILTYKSNYQNYHDKEKEFVEEEEGDDDDHESDDGDVENTDHEVMDNIPGETLQYKSFCSIVFQNIISKSVKPTLYMLCCFPPILSNFDYLLDYQQNNWMRFLLLTIGLTGSSMMICYLFYKEPIQREKIQRTFYCFLFSWFLFLVLRFTLGSMNPLFLGDSRGGTLGWFISVVAFLLTVISVCTVSLEEWLISDYKDLSKLHIRQYMDERHIVYDVEREKPSICRRILLAILRGLSLGGLLYLTHFLFSSANVISRLSMLPAYPFNIITLCALLFGIVIACISDIFRSTVGMLLMIVSTGFLFFIPNDFHISVSLFVFFSGNFICLILPTLWVSSLCEEDRDDENEIGDTENDEDEEKRMENILWMNHHTFCVFLTLLISSMIYFSLMLCTIYGTSELPLLRTEWIVMIVKQRPEIPIGISIICIIVGMRKFLVSPPYLLRKTKMMDISTHRIKTVIPKGILFVFLISCLGTFIPALLYRVTSGLYIQYEFQNSLKKQDIKKVNIMSFNVNQGFGTDGRNNFARIRELMEEYNPTIVGFQESDTMRVSSGNHDLVEYLSYHLGYHSFYGSSPRDVVTGCSVLSQHPIIEGHVGLLPTDSVLDEQGSMTHVYIMFQREMKSNYHMHFFTTYFGTINGDTSQTIGKKQAKFVINAIDELRRHKRERSYSSIVLVGTLNLEPNTTDVQSFVNASSMTNTFTELHGKHYYIPTSVSSKMLDYILYSPMHYNGTKKDIHLFDLSDAVNLQNDHTSIKIVNVTVLSRNISNHYPVKADFESFEIP